MTGRDPITLIAITTLLIVVAVMACLWPARYATRLDPLAALRHE
jgi:ABC-type antimicrobial peptide transport system permease subunit